ncbi:MAG: hypothetical protein HRT40_02640 [Campylobacteraceae bacterium]|nr:hypothetical protein [Campylobacteraceae bacterium]
MKQLILEFYSELFVASILFTIAVVMDKMIEVIIYMLYFIILLLLVRYLSVINYKGIF